MLALAGAASSAAGITATTCVLLTRVDEKWWRSWKTAQPTRRWGTASKFSPTMVIGRAGLPAGGRDGVTEATRTLGCGGGGVVLPPRVTIGSSPQARPARTKPPTTTERQTRPTAVKRVDGRHMFRTSGRVVAPRSSSEY